MPVAPFDKITQNAAENLYGDERLRANLADDEAKIVLDWALGRISAQVNTAHDEAAAKLAAQKELARVRPIVAAINALGKKPGTPRLADAVAAIEPSLAASKPLSRAETMALLTAIADKMWQVRPSSSSK
jgi:hypothetical protein